TQVEKDRIFLADESLALFEQFMQLRRDLADGKFTNLGTDAKKYVERMETQAKKQRPNFAFTYVPWGSGARGASLSSIQCQASYDATYQDAARVAREAVATPALRQWRWQQDQDKKGEAGGWANPTFDDKAWKTTDVPIDTWSALGLHNYMG